MKPFIDLGKRHKATFWSYCSAWSFLHTKLPITEYKVPTFLAYGKATANKHCHHKDVIETTKNMMIKEFEANLYSDDFFKALDNVYRERLIDTKQIMTEPINISLSEKFDRLSKNIFAAHKPMLLALKSQYLYDYFENTLKKTINDQKSVESASFLLTPRKLTFVQRENEQLINFQKAFENENIEKTKENFEQFCNKETNKKLLKDLVNQFGWFHMEYMHTPWNEEEYKENLWSRIQNQQPEDLILPSERLQSVKKNQDDFFLNYPNANELKQLSNTLQQFSYILEESKAVTVEGIYHAKPLFDEVAKSLGVSWNDLLYLTLPEITALLQSNEKADNNIIEERKNHRAILLDHGTITIYQGHSAEKLASMLIDEEIPENMDEISGIIGFPGTIKGKVNIIHSIKDRQKFKPGDILVSNDISAEFTSLLKQASAIITDQGGMICHAAIVAREFKTPCIVGTKHSTKIFKDGDIIEVNANKGIVKKLT